MAFHWYIDQAFSVFFLEVLLNENKSLTLLDINTVGHNCNASIGLVLRRI